MFPRYYSETERRLYLQELISAIEQLVPELEKTADYVDAAAVYQQTLDKAKRFFLGEFTQADLTAMSQEVPRLFWLHEEWIPPLEEYNGRFHEPEWYKNLEPLMARVARATEQLRYTGEYQKNNLPWVLEYIANQKEHHASGEAIDRMEKCDADEAEATTTPADKV